MCVKFPSLSHRVLLRALMLSASTSNFGTTNLCGYQNVDDNSSPVCAIVTTNNEKIMLTSIVEERNNLSEVLHSNELQSCANFSSHNLISENLDIGDFPPFW